MLTYDPKYPDDRLLAYESNWKRATEGMTVTNAKQQECGFKAGVRAYHANSPYDLSKTIKSLKAGAWGSETPYIKGFLQGVSEMQNPPATQKATDKA